MLIPQLSRVRIICGVNINMFKLSFLCKQNVSHCLQNITKLYKSCVLSHSKVLSTLNKIRIKTDIVQNPPHQGRSGIGLHANCVYLCVFVCVCGLRWGLHWRQHSLPVVVSHVLHLPMGRTQRPSKFCLLWNVSRRGNLSTWKSSLVLCWRSSETFTAWTMYKMNVRASDRGMVKKASAQQNTMTLTHRPTTEWL